MPQKQNRKDDAKAAYRNYLDMKQRLNEIAQDFLAQVDTRAPSRTPEARQIVTRIADDWMEVRPYSTLEKIGFGPFSRSAMVFNTSHWSEVDASPLRSALVHCGAAYKQVHTLYSRLTDEEKEEAIPGGLKP